MKWTSLNDLREKYLSFFESKGHLRLPSFPLVPINDKSLLLINSGMAPMKKYFTGEEEPPCRRVTTCQKCIRTPDLERVGHTARHGTFFEMLGNFSFGDYFKAEAIPWAWEFLTVTLEIPAERLWPSVFEDDDEAYEIWNKIIGIPAERIVRLGRADNFWEHGQGACGPCSEIYFDRGEKYGCGSENCKPGCDCDRYMEIWNNVFSQFNSDGNGGYTELRQKNIDTGMGLERLACVMQGVDNMFEVDTNRRILDTVCATAGKKYGVNKNNDVSIRVCTDHIKSAVFMICDGVIPSNEGRGYVLRRIIRRACRHGKLLGIDRPFLADLCEVAIGESCGAYPELAEKKSYILKVLSIEEERFDKTIDAGLAILNSVTENCSEAGIGQISGEDAFRLYDTFGFPLDLTKEIAAEKGLTIDEETFNSLMLSQRERARQARENISGWSNTSKTLIAGMKKTEFCGYDRLSAEADVVAVIVGDIITDEVSEGDFELILDKTPFYGEGGGQVGDTGSVTLSFGGRTANITVSDTKKTDGVYIHICTLNDGILKKGDRVEASVDVDRRRAIMRNHSGCHILQAALRNVLGSHVEQAGSYVDSERLRFDFTHFAPLTGEEIASVEKQVNDDILAAVEASSREMPIEQAKKLGAMALFGEKYGRLVRVVQMGDFSTEFCGGTHVTNTAQIGLFKIISEASVAAGVRRIEAVTGLGVLEVLSERETLIGAAAKELKVQNVSDIAKRAAAIQTELSAARHELEALNARLAASGAVDIVAKAVEVRGASSSVRLAAVYAENMETDEARSLCDEIKSKYPDMVALVAVYDGKKLNFTAIAGKDAVANGAHAGKLVGAVSAITGGRGGGRPDNAMAGGRDKTKLEDALKASADILRAMLK